MFNDWTIEKAIKQNNLKKINRLIRGQNTLSTALFHTIVLDKEDFAEKLLLKHQEVKLKDASFLLTLAIKKNHTKTFKKIISFLSNNKDFEPLYIDYLLRESISNNCQEIEKIIIEFLKKNYSGNHELRTQTFIKALELGKIETIKLFLNFDSEVNVALSMLDTFERYQYNSNSEIKNLLETARNIDLSVESSIETSADKVLLESFNTSNFLESWQMNRMALNAFNKLEEVSKKYQPVIKKIKKNSKIKLTDEEQQIINQYSRTRIIILTLAKKIAQEVFYKFRKNKKSSQLILFQSNGVKIPEDTLSAKIILNSIYILSYYLDHKVTLKDGSIETFENLILQEIYKLQAN